jgi:hypothetical protein
VANGKAALDRSFGDLMVDGVFSIERREGVDISAVKGVDPRSIYQTL